LKVVSGNRERGALVKVTIGAFIPLGHFVEKAVGCKTSRTGRRGGEAR
jgi:hypothetical protein